MPEKFSPAQARAIALGAQGLAEAGSRKPEAGLRDLVARLGVIQLDSVNVLVRSHYLPAWSRIGAYDRARLDTLANTAPRTLFEFWGHEASWLPVELQPLLRWRMARAAEDAWKHVRAIRTRRAFLAKVLAAVEERGPLTAGELELGKPSRSGWWEWSDAKRAIEWLFWSGQVTTAARRGFERLYDLPSRVLPQAILDAPTPREADAQRALIDRAGAALGIATEADLRDYYRIGTKFARPAIAALVEDKRLRAVQVAGWAAPAYLHADANVDVAIDPARAALLSPFDNMIWARDRTERLFGMRYRLEIYTPAAKRVHGYYVLPMLLGDRLVARVDLKADREASVLRVHAAHGEPGIARRTVVRSLAAELRGLAGWLGLSDVIAAPSGDLGSALVTTLAR